MSAVDTGRSGMLRAKAVMLGAPGVGKTSLVRQFVHSIFSDAYHSTLGVKVDRKSVTVEDIEVSMLLWDIHGEAEGLAIPRNYLSGVAAAILVFDATQPETVAVSQELAERVLQSSPDAILQHVGNKCDLESDWVTLDERLAGSVAMATSAKTGEGVARVFESIAARIVAQR